LEPTVLYTGLAILAGVGLITYYFSSSADKKPKTDTLYTDALNAMMKADRAKAIRLLKDVVKQDSDHIMAYLQLGNIIREEHPQQATKIHQSLTVRPKISKQIKVDIHQSLALDYKEIGKLQLAKREAESILKLEKRNLWALEFLLELAETGSNWDEASSWAKQIQRVTGTKNDNELAKFHVYKGLQKFENGLTDDARNFFLKAVKTSPEFGLSYRYLGDIYEQTRDLVKAVENWEAFATKDLKNGHLVFEKIESALFDLGRYSEVENFYRRILDLDSSNFEAVIRLANVLEEKGETSSALTLVEDAMAGDRANVRGNLMKLKLSLTTNTPVELSYQIDSILDKLSEDSDV